jgi:hypothetical protein
MRRLSRREAGLSARECALIESAWLRLRKHPRERVMADLTTAIVQAGFDEDTAQREALALSGSSSGEGRNRASDQRAGQDSARFVG